MKIPEGAQKTVKSLTDEALKRLHQRIPGIDPPTVEQTAVAVVCDCQWIVKSMRRYWVELVVSSVKRAQKKQLRDIARRQRQIAREIERMLMRQPGYQHKLF